MRKTLEISQERLRELFYYDPKYDQVYPLRWKVRRTSSVDRYTPPKNGEYARLRVDGAMYRVSRLVWVFHNGPIPEGLEIDHVDRNRLNNDVANLRIVTSCDNNRNRSIKGASRFRGIHWHKQNQQWRVWVRVNGPQLHIGYSRSEVTAAALYDAAMNYAFGPDHGHPTNESEGLLTPEHRVTLPDRTKARIDRILGKENVNTIPRDTYRDQAAQERSDGLQRMAA